MNPLPASDEKRQPQQTGHFQEGSEIALNFVSAQCPICNSKIVNGVCDQHGTICETCGTIYRDPFCPNCYAPVSSQFGQVSYLEINQRARQNPRALRLGELAIAPKELAAITGRQSITRKESNILRAASEEEPIKKKIGQKVESAVRWLNLPRSKEIELIETVEKNTFSLIARYRTEALSAGRKIHVSLEKVIEYSFLTEAKKIGRTITEVQEALAKAGFNVKLQLFTIRVAIPYGSDLSSVRMYVNGWKREPGSFELKELAEGPIGREYTVSIQALLSDTIDQRGRMGVRSWLEVRFDNAIILPGAESPTSTIGKAKNEKNKIRFDQKDPHIVWLGLNAWKCFTLFRNMNHLMERGPNFDDRPVDSGLGVIEASIRQHLPLPSKKFPASAALMQRVSCLSKVEKRSVELFRNSLKNSEGRSRRTLAREALIRADQEVYSSLSPSVKLAMKAYISTLPFKRKRDRLYAGVRGLLLPSEVIEGE
jgi:hypothetical protein